MQQLFVEMQWGFEARIAASGWHDHFEQVNLSGTADTAPEALAKLVLLQTASARGQ